MSDMFEIDNKKTTNYASIMVRSCKLSKTKFILLLFIIPLLNIYAQNPDFDSLAHKINKSAIYNRTKSIEMLDDLYRMAYQSPDSGLLAAHCFYEASALNYRQGIVDTQLSVRIKNKLESKQLSLYEHALLQSALGTNLMCEKGYADAFPLHFQALEKFKYLNNKRYTARMLNSLGNICYYFDLFNLAENYYSEAITYITRDYHEYYYIKTNYFRVQSLNSTDEAPIDSLFALLEIVQQANYEELLPVLYLNIGVSLFERDPERAISYFTKIQSLNFENPKWLAVLHSYMGSYYAGKEDFEIAFRYFYDALKVMEENNDFYSLKSMYINIADIYEQQGQYEKGTDIKRAYAIRKYPYRG